VTSDTIHFALDQYDIDPEPRDPRQPGAQWLAQSEHARHDRRALRRARHPRIQPRAGRSPRQCREELSRCARHLAARITTISYGKERPIALGSDEQSWAQNRRAVTIVIN
jgi:peptidoglycan-associated lipoprotein